VGNGVSVGKAVAGGGSLAGVAAGAGSSLPLQAMRRVAKRAMRNQEKRGGTLKS
jgi:hypothetical protein